MKIKIAETSFPFVACLVTIGALIQAGLGVLNAATTKLIVSFLGSDFCFDHTASVAVEIAAAKSIRQIRIWSIKLPSSLEAPRACVITPAFGFSLFLHILFPLTSATGI